MDVGNLLDWAKSYFEASKEHEGAMENRDPHDSMYGYKGYERISDAEKGFAACLEACIDERIKAALASS